MIVTVNAVITHTYQ